MESGLAVRGVGARLIRALGAYSAMTVVEFATWMAVLFYGYQQGGAVLAGGLAFLQLVPAGLLSPLIGSIGDRMPRGRALVLLYGALGAACAALAVALASDNTLAVLPAAIAVSVGISGARLIHYSALPQLALTPSALVRANSASAFAEGVALFLGPVLAGLAVEFAGTWLVGVGAAVVMAGAALACVGLHLPRPAQPEEPASVVADAAHGVRLIARDRPVLLLVLLLGVSFLVTGTLEILDVAFAEQVLHVDATATGALVGADGIGGLVGAAVAATLAHSRRLSPIAVGALALAGLPLIAFVGVAALLPAIVLVSVTGLGQTVNAVASRTLLQRTSDGTQLARVFSVQEAITMFGLAAGALLGPLLEVSFGARMSYAIVGVGVVVLSLAVWPVLRGLDDRARVRPDVIRLLRGVRFLAQLPPDDLERLAQDAVWMHVDEETPVVTQGEVGDAFYVVSAGSLSVTVDGDPRPELSPGAHFGEIALLRDIPRTATVTAEEPCELLSFERDTFLAAVTGSPDGHAVAQEVAESLLLRDAS